MTTPPNYPQPGPYGPPQPYGQPPQQGHPQQQGYPQQGAPGWGQQPPPQPPYGTPPQQPPYGAQPPPYGQQVMPPPPPVKQSKGSKVLVTCVLLGVVGVVVAGIIASIGAPSGAEPGECIKVNSQSVADADVEKIDCGLPDAAFKVAKNLDSSGDACPTGDYTEYTESGRRRSDGFKLCLVLNAKEGDCFQQEGTIVAGKTTKVTCGSSASFKVSKVSTGKADESLCEPGETAEVYSEPATTLCLAEPTPTT